MVEQQAFNLQVQGSTPYVFSLGFYSLIGKVFDCDSNDIGSNPIKNPKSSKSKNVLIFCSFDGMVDVIILGVISILQNVGSSPTKSINIVCFYFLFVFICLKKFLKKVRKY